MEHLANYHWYDFVGNIGAFGIVLAFYLIQAGKIKADDIRYSLLNGISAGLIVVSLLFNFNLSSFLIELFWISISIMGILKWLKARRMARVVTQQ
ncbi:CBU_0592 family membrane protein [Ewingella americana]|uniref:CBU-0592-like domain-containing protein n=1 Tax=Ewingella americana TaxID=41202 RepID=A0A502GDQ6_9GAMM|nr:hypothetical protein [Ewingella americana]TPG60045.1 hypothetical protein EAH77_15880 [Ewingella americana]